MSTVVMGVEGVLGDRPTFDITMQCVPTARLLYSVLEQSYRVVLVTDQSDPNKAAHWLRTNGIVGWSQLHAGITEAADTVANRCAQLRALRSSRTVIDFVIDIHPKALAYAASIGIPGMLWLPAARAGQRADLSPPPIRSWEEMVPDDPRVGG